MWGAPSGKSDYQGLLGLLPNECTDAVCDLLCPKPLRSKACLGNYSSAATAIGAAVNGRERPIRDIRFHRFVAAKQSLIQSVSLGYMRRRLLRSLLMSDRRSPLGITSA